MAGFFTVKVSGEGTLQNDLNSFLLTLRSPIKSALNSVADEFTQSLDKHIQNDVYGAYQPKHYPRRPDNESLLSPKYKEIKVNDFSLSFQYEPKGFHKGRKKDILGAEYDDIIHEWVILDKETGATKDIIEDPNAPLKPHPVHGDRLIQRIQTGEGYDWQPPKGEDSFPARPFWNNFVEEQKNGAAMDSFAYGFGSNVVDLVREGGNRDIQWGDTEGMLEAGIVDDEDYELPW